MMSYSLEQADILIDLKEQILYLPKHNKFYVISSGEKGIGEAENSGKTPRGWHKISVKVGQNVPENTVFIARRETGEIYDTNLAEEFPERDWILSRILWLSGLEEGFNLGDGCDTFNRYIYIHGTPDSEPMGVPKSHGCIRMRNSEVIELFDLVEENALVYISEEKLDFI
jgi:hypothetical protein